MEEKEKKDKIRNNPLLNLISSYRENKKAFIVYSVLRILVLLTAVRCIFTKNWEQLATCILVLILFLLPAVVQKLFKIKIPGLFQGIIFCFIFAAEILGEIDHFYVRIPGWDTMLHTMNGFLCAAVGLSMVYLLNRSSDNIKLSPLYLALVAFCFSMTVGVLWEFFECSMDLFFNKDMQKDFIVQKFSSVTLDPLSSGNVIHVYDIVGTTIKTASGEVYEIADGYLDIGILDTMKDLFVNFIGAVVMSTIGFIYEANNHENDKSIARGLMLTVDKKEETKK